MSKQRELSRQEVLNLIQEREQKGIQPAQQAKACFITKGALYNSVHHYGLFKQWTNALIKYEKRMVREAIQLRKHEGLTLNGIEERLGVSIKQVYRYAKRHGLSEDFKRTKHSANYTVYAAPKGKDKRRIPLPWLYNQRVVFGYSYEEIAREFQCTPRRIRTECERRGFQKPSKAVYMKNRQNVNASIDADWDKIDLVKAQ